MDVTDTEAVVKACDDAALVWLESPTNPALELADIETLTAAAHEAGAYVAVDNTFATPLLQTPLAQGVDLVVHSATKYLAGHSDVLLGAICTRDDELYGVLKNRRDLMGAIPGTFEAWLVLRGMRTLHIRVERAQANALELVRRLPDHPAIAEVRYPGFGGIVSIVLAQGAIAADLLTHKTRLWVHATSLGGVESTLERRRRWKAEAPTIPEGLVRLSRRDRGRRGPLGRPSFRARRLCGVTELVNTHAFRRASRLRPSSALRCSNLIEPTPRPRSTLATGRLNQSQPWCRAR